MFEWGGWDCVAYRLPAAMHPSYWSPPAHREYSLHCFIQAAAYIDSNPLVHQSPHWYQFDLRSCCVHFPFQREFGGIHKSGRYVSTPRDEHGDFIWIHCGECDVVVYRMH